MRKNISVIIPVKNEEKKIVNCLNAIFLQTLQPFEVIVVDGNSTDNTVKNARQFPVKIVFENYGTIGGARQIGIEHAQGNLIAFTDADCVPRSDWLENLSKNFSEDLKGIGGGIRNIGDSLWEKTIFLVFDSFLGSGGSVQDRVFANKKMVRSLSGCNAMYRTDDLKNIGGFNIKLAINEDTDLSTRLRKSGNLLYIPEAEVLHDQSLNLKEFAKRNYTFGFGRAYNHLWDIQMIPPLLAVMVLMFAFLNLQFFYFMIFLYVIILIGYDFIIVFKKKKGIFLLTIPIVFIIQHVSYSFGFWAGIFSNMVSIKR